MKLFLNIDKALKETGVTIEVPALFKKEKLYELETKLPPKKFVRLSKSVIANLHQLNRFDLSFNGTLCVHFKSGKKKYVSRNYVPVIKEALKLNRRKVE